MRASLPVTLLAVALLHCGTRTAPLAPPDDPPPEQPADAGPGGPRRLAVGWTLTCVLGDDATVRCAGGYSSVAPPPVLDTGGVPIRYPGLTDIRQVSMGAYHGCALRRDGQVVCWGIGWSGELGPAERDVAHNRPVRVPLPLGVVEVVAGLSKSCARRSDGTLWCWGSTQRGALCVPDGPNQYEPRPLPGTTTVAQVSLGYFTCWIDGGGETHCCGESDDHGRFDNFRVRDAVQVAVGVDHVCALTRAGEVWCQGNNAGGQIGDGTQQYRREPIRVSGVGEVVQIAVGDAHTCALRRDRTVWCWGPMRTLGSADVDVRTPFWIPELHDVVEIGSGIVHVCARTSSGDVLCWGDNTHGQLGDGSTVSRSVPVRFGG